MSKGRNLSIGAVVAVTALLGGVMFGGTADAKKKKKSGNVFTATNTAAQAIPDALGPPSFVYGRTSKSFVAGKKFKNKRVANVDVTFQTIGNQAQSASDMTFELTAPDGRTQDISGGFFTGQSIGPLHITGNTPFTTCDPPVGQPCNYPNGTVIPPYIGTARDNSMALFQGAPVRGTWTVTAYDQDDVDTSTLGTVSITVTAQRPIK